MHVLKFLVFTQVQQSHNSLIWQNKITCMGKMKKKDMQADAIEAKIISFQ